MSEDTSQSRARDQNADSEDSPFHRGERIIQQRLGVSEKIEDFGRRGIRDFMPEQHRLFFTQLPMFLIGSADSGQRPWASILVGEPGFIHSPDPKRLHIAAMPSAEDPFTESLRDGAMVGGLGIELDTRRRNRVNGKAALDEGGGGFSIRVDQSFGNCAKYIQARKPRFARQPSLQDGQRSIRRFTHFDSVCRAMLARSDTFFIASQFGDDPRDGRRGMDVSHRGGPPGFLAQVDDQTLLWPDYRGNFFFNTFGNIELDPRCGLLILDFETGDTLQLTGTAEVLWDAGHADSAFEGAQRSVRFYLGEGIHVRSALPFAWEFLGQAPQFSKAPNPYKSS
jgi:predicted pyridoxine 5'-phosphate oxidase superfamily flavin-nucleotide-binding protein